VARDLHALVDGTPDPRRFGGRGRPRRDGSGETFWRRCDQRCSSSETMNRLAPVPAVRIAFCPRCRKHIAVCTSCDTGQVYCEASCAALARGVAVRGYRQRYRSSPKGRLKHSAAERRRRARRRAGVGDHTSALSPPMALGPKAQPPARPVVVREPQALLPNPITCNRCGVAREFVLFRDAGRAGRCRPAFRPVSTPTVNQVRKPAAGYTPLFALLWSLQPR
jgi:hypothetical protein